MISDKPAEAHSGYSLDMSETPSPPIADPYAIEVLFFGGIADRFGRRLRLPIPSEGISLADLRRRLAAVGCDRVLQPALRIAVDRAIVHGEAIVRPGQEVAFMSPFSGG